MAVKVIVKMLLACWRLLVLLVELLFWLLSGARGLTLTLTDAVHARKALTSGILRCPAGHEIPTEGIFECGKCGFVYKGSAWQCANVECQALTVFLNCPTCGLSQRNPHRWGRP